MPSESPALPASCQCQSLVLGKRKRRFWKANKVCMLHSSGGRASVTVHRGDESGVLGPLPKYISYKLFLPCFKSQLFLVQSPNISHGNENCCLSELLLIHGFPYLNNKAQGKHYYLCNQIPEGQQHTEYTQPTASDPSRRAAPKFPVNVKKECAEMSHNSAGKIMCNWSRLGSVM